MLENVTHSDLTISIRSYKSEQTLPSHSQGLSRALFFGAGCSMGRCFGLPEPQGTLSARSYFNQELFYNPKALKVPRGSAVTPCMPLKPGTTLSFWQCPNHDQNKAVQAAQWANYLVCIFCRSVTITLFLKKFCCLRLHLFLPTGESFLM